MMAKTKPIKTTEIDLTDKDEQILDEIWVDESEESEND